VTILDVILKENIVPNRSNSIALNVGKPGGVPGNSLPGDGIIAEKNSGLPFFKGPELIDQINGGGLIDHVI